MRKFRKRAYPYILMLPAIVLVALVSFIPMGYAIRESMYKTHYLELVEFVGLGRYAEVLTSPTDLQAIYRSWVHVLGTLGVAIPTAFLLAVLLNRSFRFRTVFRSILILPYAVSWMITAFLWMWLYNPYYGPINYVLESLFNWTIPDFTESPLWAMPTLVQTTAWRLFPLAMLFILAGLQTVPVELIEAAKIDGASGWQSLWSITFPLIKNTVLVAMVLVTLFTFNLVTLTLTLTRGGPGEVTTTLAFKVFQEGFEFWHLGYASALAVILFIFNIGLSFLYMRVLKAERYY